MQGSLLCEWVNASLSSGRNLPGVRFQICVYPNAHHVDRWVSRQIKANGFWEQHMVQEMLSVLRGQRQHNPLLVDIGANIGFYTLAAAAAGFDVYAFEPVPRNAEMLRASLERNRLAHRVTLHTFALGQEPTTLSMGVSSDNQGAVSHLKNRANYTTSKIDVRLASLSLNSVLPSATRRPLYLKVDIEGGECEALPGASNLFSNWRIVGANMEMQPATRKCCVQQGWQASGGPFYHMRSTHALCSFSRSAPVTNPCNATGPWDIQWRVCPGKRERETWWGKV
jgi:FkbM family methyltransferase